MGDTLVADLEALLGGRVTGLRRLSGGASRETWSFDVERDHGFHEGLILRRDPPGTGARGMAREAALLTAAARAGVPVPRVVASGDDRDAVGSPYVVTERLEGETIPRRILRDDTYRAARDVLASQCGAALAAIHRIPLDALPHLDDVDQLDSYRGVFDGLEYASPAFELAFRWLARNRPARVATAVVHGDFRNGNLLVGPEGVRAVLDWELAHLGDPLEDLGWLCVKSWRFGSALPVGGFGHYDELIGAYEASDGSRVDRDALAWWEVLGNLKWGIMCILQTMTHISGRVRSVELAAIGRRVGEVEWDLLAMLQGRHG